MKTWLTAAGAALIGTLIAGAPAFADMNKTAPAIPAAPGSKAESAVSEGIAHYDKGHWDVAKKHFQEALKTDQQSAEAHYDLALTLDKSGDHKGAIEHFKAAKELGQNNPHIQNSGILQAHLKPQH